MFGFIENDGVGWEGMELLKVLLFGYKINGWNGMGEDEIHSIQFYYNNYATPLHSTPLYLIPFHYLQPIQT